MHKIIQTVFTGAMMIIAPVSFSQVQWHNVDSLFAPLPPSVHVYRTTTPLGGKPNVAYYFEARLDDRALEFTVDTTLNRRLTPNAFYQKNERPLLVVNTTFFSFASNRNLNAVVRSGKLLGFNQHSLPGRGKDTLTYWHTTGSAIGISKKRKADVAWLYTDSSAKHALAFQDNPVIIHDSVARFTRSHFTGKVNKGKDASATKWKMQTAVGGGPVLVHDGKVRITNNEERKFGGRAIDDRHPRTAMGYTRSGKFIVLVVEGRNAGVAEGATLVHLADMLRELGCEEGLNLDGGGSTCMLINGAETIKPSDKEGQRPVPAVFIVKTP